MYIFGYQLIYMIFLKLKKFIRLPSIPHPENSGSSVLGKLLELKGL